MGFPPPSMSPLMVTLPPVKKVNPLGKSRIDDDRGSLQSRANWMFQCPGRCGSHDASWREIPSGRDCNQRRTEDVSPLIAIVAFVTVITVPRSRTQRNSHKRRSIAFRADPPQAAGNWSARAGSAPMANKTE